MNRKRIKEILDLIINSPDDKIRYELVQTLFTHTELEQLSARFEIIRGLIKNELTQRELAAELKLSIAKITRGSNELKRRSQELLTYLNTKFSKRKSK